MVQAEVILLYLVYLSSMIYIIYKYYKMTQKLKTINDGFLMAIHDIKNFSINIDVSSQLLQTITRVEDGIIKYNVFSKHMEVITNNCREMNGLIENYAKTVKLEENYDDSISKEDIVGLVEEAVKLNKYYAKKKSIHVEIKTIWTEKYMELDKGRSIRILCNLIMNGIKYSYEGDKILISILGDDDWIEVHVIDRGLSMTYNELKRAFDKHYTTNNISDTFELSLGVGLYASRHLARRQGGDLWAESTKGEGSTFILKLPVKNVGNKKRFWPCYEGRISPKKTSI